jgi:hypothetical protein
MAGDPASWASPATRGDNPRVPAAVRAAVFEIGAVGEVLGRAVQDGGFHLVRLVGKTDAHERSPPTPIGRSAWLFAGEDRRARESARSGAARQFP